MPKACSHALKNHISPISTCRKAWAPACLQTARCCAARGAMATQFGHYSIDRNGPECPCGNRGCLERIVGENALGERAAACGLDVTPWPGESFLQRCGRHGAKWRCACARADSRPCAGPCVGHFKPDFAVQPVLIIIGGTGVKLGRGFYPICARRSLIWAFGSLSPRVRMQYSQLGLDAELTGRRSTISTITTTFPARCSGAVPALRPVQSGARFCSFFF